MKKSIFKLSFILINICSGSFTLSSQIETVWFGGNPGHETEWNCHKNWSTNHVPDWSSDVIIPNRFTDAQHFPIISNEIIEVNTLDIKRGAKLILSDCADLMVIAEKEIEGQIIREEINFVDGF
jgi:hypothetical protein